MGQSMWLAIGGEQSCKWSNVEKKRSELYNRSSEVGIDLFVDSSN